MVLATKFGMAYFVWHCLTAGQTYDISQALAGRQPLGPVPALHWWSRPAPGYYCPTVDRAIVRRHGELLRDAGIDFVFVDLTNFTKAEGQAITGGLEPLRTLLQEWSTVPGSPRVVPWLPLARGATLPDAVDRELSAYPAMRFVYQGKPLLLHAANPAFEPDPGLAARLSLRYTLRPMWANLPDRTSWSFMAACRPDFKASGGNGRCEQRVALGLDGRVEQVSVTTAYQRTYMSETSTAVPKFHGRTFRAQMKRVDDFPGVPIVTITGWNEWIAQRFCVRGGLPVGECGAGASPTLPNGNPVFVDQFDEEYNRDLEPGGASGAYYYGLLRDEVLRRKPR